MGSAKRRCSLAYDARSVLMTMMNVRVMRVGMFQPRVPMPVSMRFARRIGRRVFVLVVLVVVVEMFVF